MRKVQKTEMERIADSIKKLDVFSDFVVNIKNALHAQIVNETYIDARIQEIRERVEQL